MNYLLDTNVLCEPSKPRPNKRVLDWLDATPVEALYISVLSMGELTRGLVQMLDRGNRDRAEYYQAWLIKIREQYRDRMLPIDAPVAETWGMLTSAAALPVADALILATARMRCYTIATRNTRDFANRGVKVFNPWTD